MIPTISAASTPSRRPMTKVGSIRRRSDGRVAVVGQSGIACLPRVRRTLQPAATIVGRAPDARQTGTCHGATTLGRRLPRDDLVPRLPDRRVPALDHGHARARLARRGDARRLPRVGGRDAEAAGEAEGLVERGEHKEAILTATGRERAERVVRKHRIIERLLTDFMGYTAAEAHVHADELGDTFTDDMIERMEEKLGYPERCPHGWPVDTELEQRENRELAPLSALAAGRPGDDRPARRARRRAPALVLRPGARPGHEGRGDLGRSRRPGR